MIGILVNKRIWKRKNKKKIVCRSHFCNTILQPFLCYCDSILHFHGLHEAIRVASTAYFFLSFFSKQVFYTKNDLRTFMFIKTKLCKEFITPAFFYSDINSSYDMDINLQFERYSVISPSQVSLVHKLISRSSSFLSAFHLYKVHSESLQTAS